MKKISLVTLAAVLIAAAPALGQLMTENFEYAVGDLVAGSSGNWVHFSGSGLNIQVSSGSLVYPEYPASDVGNKIEIVSTSGSSAEDAYRQFASQPVGSEVYYAFLLTIPNTTGMLPDTSTNGDYITAFLPPTSTSTFADRVCVKLGSTASNFKIGVRVSGVAGNNTVWGSAEYATGTTYLVVVRHSMTSTGTTDDTTRVWVNPSIPGVEPSADIVATLTAGSDPDSIARVAIRQGSNTPNASIDGLTVGNTWGSVTGVAGSPAAVTNATFTLAPINPNPISRPTQIQYSLREPGQVNLGVFNILGQQVATLVDGNQASGSHTASWRLRDDKGAMVPNGIYFFKLTANGQTITRRAMVVR
jgi:hypothetical protein